MGVGVHASLARNSLTQSTSLVSSVAQYLELTFDSLMSDVTLFGGLAPWFSNIKAPNLLTDLPNPSTIGDWEHGFRDSCPWL